MMIQQTSEAEQQYTWLCRVLEQGYKEGEVDPVVDFIRDLPLYLLSTEKSKRAEQVAFEQGRKYMQGYEHLPMPCVMADHFSCVVLLKSERIKDEIITETLIINHRKTDNIIFYTHGLLVDAEPDGLKHTSNWEYRPQVMWLLELDGTKITPTANLLKDPMGKSMIQDCVSHSKTAIEQLKYATNRSHYIVKECGPEMKRFTNKKKKMKKLYRIDQREVHRFYDPEEMKTMYKSRELNGTHASPVPHKRGAHVRVYKHPRFKNVVGKTMKIKEVLVNCKEGEELKIGKKVFHIVSTPKGI